MNKEHIEYIKHLIKFPISRKSRNWIRDYSNNPKIKLIMTLLVKNEEEILETNILFHRAMGVDGFIVTSHNSTDNTNKILEKLKNEGLVLEIIYETSPRYDQSKFVDKMIKLAKNKYKANWVINADADEFYYSNSLDLKKSIIEAQKAGLNSIITDSIVLFPDDKLNYIMDSYYFITNPLKNFEKNLIKYVDLKGIFNGYSERFQCPKIIHNTKDYIGICMGNHCVTMRNKKIIQSADIKLYHYHIRNYKQWEEKIKRYIDTEMPKGCGIHMIQMIEMYKSGKLREAYDKRFGENIRNILINEGAVSIDKSVSNFIKWKIKQ